MTSISANEFKTRGAAAIEAALAETRADLAAGRCLKRHPDLARPYLKTLQLLEVNPFVPSSACTSALESWPSCTLFPLAFPVASRSSS